MSVNTLAAAGGALLSVVMLASTALAQSKEIKIGVIYDYTGAFAAGGSAAAGAGTKIAVDMINEKGGVEGYKINATYVDAQSKTDVAINEAERLLNNEKVDLIMGLFSSAHCVPLAAKVDAAQKFFWVNVCIATAVFKDRNLKYVFRAHVHGDQFGETACVFLGDMAKDKLKKDVKDIKVAILYEDGPYGTGIAGTNESKCKELGIQVLLKEGYAATSTDLGAVVTKLRRLKPDVILHTGYNPDITLFLRQAKEAGLKFDALIGHGAGYGQIDKLNETFGKDVNFFFNVDSAPGQLLDPKTLAPGVGDLMAEVAKRYKAVTKADQLPTHVSAGFNQAWTFLNDVLPRAIKTHGGIDPEALRKSALETDIAEGGTIQGYGVKFYPPGDKLAGQNARSFPIVMQYVDAQIKVAWPTKIRTTDPVIPFPKGHAYAKE